MRPTAGRTLCDDHANAIPGGFGRLEAFWAPAVRAAIGESLREWFPRCPKPRVFLRFLRNGVRKTVRFTVFWARESAGCPGGKIWRGFACRVGMRAFASVCARDKPLWRASGSGFPGAQNHSQGVESAGVWRSGWGRGRFRAWVGVRHAIRESLGEWLSKCPKPFQRCEIWWGLAPSPMMRAR